MSDSTRIIQPWPALGSEQNFGSRDSFVALRSDGTIVSWGNITAAPTYDVGSTRVVEIVSSSQAHAALLDNGTVLTWGNSSQGGDSTSVKAAWDPETGSPAVAVYARSSGFAAILENGEVITWGRLPNRIAGPDGVTEASGGRTFSPEMEITSIQQSFNEFVAIDASGQAFVWPAYFNASPRPAELERVEAVININSLGVGVEQLVFLNQRGAALLGDGSVYFWGEFNPHGATAINAPGGQIIPPRDGMVVREIAQVGAGIAIVYEGDENHHVVLLSEVWADAGLHVTAADPNLTTHQSLVDLINIGNDAEIVSIASTVGATSVLMSDGEIYIFGGLDRLGGSIDFPGDEERLLLDPTFGQPVQSIVGAFSDFAALRADGSVVSWGRYTGPSAVEVGGVSDPVMWSDVEHLLSGRPSGSLDQESRPVVEVVPVGGGMLGNGFVAIRDDGSAVAWGAWPFVPPEELRQELLNPSSPVVQVHSTDAAVAILRADGSVDTWGPWPYGGDSSAVADQLSSGVVGLASPFGSPAETGLGPGSGDGAGPGEPGLPGDAPGVETGLLTLVSDLGWQDVGGELVSVEGAVVHLGHAMGDAGLLRVENGSVTVSGGTVTVDGQVFSAQHAPDRLLFDGGFNVHTATLAVSGFDGGTTPYSVLGDGVTLRFADMVIAPQEVRLAADVAFGSFFSALDTSGAPLRVTLSDAGLDFGVSEVGFAFDEQLSLPVPGTQDMGLTFSDLAFDFDGLRQELFLHGKAALQWGGSVLDQLGSIGAKTSNLVLDLVRSDSGDDRGNFLVLRPGTEGGLDWDIAAEITYQPGDGLGGVPIRDLSLGINSIEQSFAGSVTSGLPFVPGVDVSGSLGGFWNPLRLDSLSFGLDGLNIPVATTGLFLNGGSVGVEGLANTPEVPEPVRVFGGSVNFTFGSTAGGAPSPLQGSIEGSFSRELVTGSFDIDSRVGYFLGDTVGDGLVDALQRYFGLDIDAILDFQLLGLSGMGELDLENSRMRAELTADVLQGLFSGIAFIDIYNKKDIQFFEMGATGTIQLPPALTGAAINGSVVLNYSDDNDPTNDFLMVWGSVDLPFNLELGIGFEIGFDGSWSVLTSAPEIELVNSWELDETNEFTLLSANWETPVADAALVLIGPDGTRLHEAEFDTDPNVILIEELSSSTSRHVMLKSPAAGLWKLDVESGAALGELRREASRLEDGPTVSVDVANVDVDARTASLNVVTSNHVAGSRLVVSVSTVAGAVAGQRVAEFLLDETSSNRTLPWDFNDFASGDYFVTATIFAEGRTPVVAQADEVVEVPNNAPSLEPGQLSAVEDGPTVMLDLAALASDIDFDDNGTTLTYAILEGPSEGAATISGFNLFFDPGSDFRDLSEGESRDVVVRVSATDRHGATAEADVTVTVTGVKDPASISGDTTGAVIEDDADRQQASGVLTVTDPDAGEDRFREPEAAALQGSYGLVAFDPISGAWSYTLDNDADAVQALPEGAEVTDRLTVTSLDGIASETITVTVKGTGVRDDTPPEPEDTVVLAGAVVDRAGNELAGTSVTFTPDGGGNAGVDTDASGWFSFELPVGSTGHLDAARGHGAGDPSISTTSALEALRMAVGLNPSWGPAEPMDFIAADFNGDGRVTTADALGILRVAVGLTAEQAPRWLFVDSDADLSEVSRSNTHIDTGLRLDPIAGNTTDLSLTGILVGHVQEYA